MHDRPEWWEWEFFLSPHVNLRMEDRDLSEVELRDMIEQAARLVRDHVPGRWLAMTRHRARPWCLVLEPDFDDRLVVVITVFEVD